MYENLEGMYRWASWWYDGGKTRAGKDIWGRKSAESPLAEGRTMYSVVRVCDWDPARCGRVASRGSIRLDLATSRRVVVLESQWGMSLVGQRVR